MNVPSLDYTVRHSRRVQVKNHFVPAFKLYVYPSRGDSVRVCEKIFQLLDLTPECPLLLPGNRKMEDGASSQRAQCSVCPAASASLLQTSKSQHFLGKGVPF